MEPNGIIRTYLLYYSKTISDPLLTNSNKVMELRISGNITSKYLPGLESDTEYYFWVKASTSVGVGNGSAVVRQTTKDTSKYAILASNCVISISAFFRGLYVTVQFCPFGFCLLTSTMVSLFTLNADISIFSSPENN